MGSRQSTLVLVFTVAVCAWLGYALVRALMAGWSARRSQANDDAAQAERVRAEIRRTREDRKANPLPPLLPPEQRSAKVTTVTPGPLDPFGGPVRRWWHKLKARLRPKAANRR